MGSRCCSFDYTSTTFRFQNLQSSVIWICGERFKKRDFRLRRIELHFDIMRSVRLWLYTLQLSCRFVSYRAHFRRAMDNLRDIHLDDTIWFVTKLECLSAYMSQKKGTKGPIGSSTVVLTTLSPLHHYRVHFGRVMANIG